MAVTAVVQSLLLFIFLAVGCLPGIFAKRGRIVGGYTTDINKVPYMVSLRRNNDLVCGGSLITKEFVVSAAHCTHGHHPHEFEVVGGATNLSSGGVYRKVDSIFAPSSYVPVVLHMDFVVLLLSFPMTGPNIKPIKLCNHIVPVGAMVTVSGWGRISHGGEYSDQLRSVEVKTISHSKCKEDFDVNAIITDSMMCASVPGTKDACSGDSGGPMVHGNELCGVVSFGLGCAKDYFPGVYTDLYKVRSFIIEVLEKYYKRTSSSVGNQS